MSLYNQLHGVNPAAGMLLGLLGLTHSDVPRFRDCYLRPDGKIVILSRTGGGNRKDYELENEKLRITAGFLEDHDDEYDCTFALWIYEPPADTKALIQQMIDANLVEHDSLRTKSERVLNDFTAGKDTEQTRRMAEIGKKLNEQIANLPNGGVLRI